MCRNLLVINNVRSSRINNGGNLTQKRYTLTSRSGKTADIVASYSLPALAGSVVADYAKRNVQRPLSLRGEFEYLLV